MTTKDFRCGTRIRTAKGWFNIIRIWNYMGRVSDIELEARGKTVRVDAQKLADHTLETEVI